jgi:hypothetical protein
MSSSDCLFSDSTSLCIFYGSQYRHKKTSDMSTIPPLLSYFAPSHISTTLTVFTRIFKSNISEQRRT